MKAGLAVAVFLVGDPEATATAQVPRQTPVAVFADACLATGGDIDKIDALAQRRGWVRPPNKRALTFLQSMYPAPEASVFQVSPGTVLSVESRPKPQGALGAGNVCRTWFTTELAEQARKELEAAVVGGRKLGPPDHAYDGFGFDRIKNWRAEQWRGRQPEYSLTLASGKTPGRKFDFNTLIQVTFPHKPE